VKTPTIQLGELVTIAGGGTPSRDRPEYYDGDIPWITVKDFGDGYFIRSSQERISKLGLENSAARLIPAGSVILGTRMSVGKAAINLVDVAINQDLKALFCCPKLDPCYLTFFLTASAPRLEAQANGATVKGITIDNIEELEIPLHSLSKQQRIAGVLEEADRLRSVRRYALELSDTFLPAVFLEFYGALFHKGPFNCLGNLVKITGGGTPSRDRYEFFRGRIPWLTSKDMRGDYIWDTEEHITDDAIKNSSTNLVPANSILVVVKSKILMHRLPVAIAKVPMCHGQDIKSIQCSNKLHPEFSRFVLKYHEKQLLNIARGANTEGLTLPMLEELPVPQVDYSEQHRFAVLVEHHERLRAGTREVLRQAEHLFQSLLHRAFTIGI
jgi:type I restriction enzyme S subunit